MLVFTGFTTNRTFGTVAQWTQCDALVPDPSHPGCSSPAPTPMPVQFRFVPSSVPVSNLFASEEIETPQPNADSDHQAVVRLSPSGKFALWRKKDPGLGNKLNSVSVGVRSWGGGSDRNFRHKNTSCLVTGIWSLPLSEIKYLRSPQDICGSVRSIVKWRSWEKKRTGQDCVRYKCCSP